MEQKKAILLLTTLHCINETSGGGSDEIYIRVYCDGKEYGRYPTGNGFWSMDTGDSDSVDVEIDCTYVNEVSIDIWELDKETDDGSTHKKDDHVGWMYIRRGDQLDANNCGSRKVYQSSDDAVYQLDFRVISDPIPTVRVLALRCEAQSAGMNTELVAAIAGIASDCAKAAGKIIRKSPRPSRKLIGDAFIAVSKILKGLENFAEFIGGILEGGDDDVYIKHVAETETRSYDGGFFPPDANDYSMKEGDEVYFEEEYGHYFRFPLDMGPVTIELREYDAAKLDIIIGSLIIDPAQIAENTNIGIGGGSPPTDEDIPPIEGGVAVMDGPAVVEIANSYYGRHNGEGAVYHLCYSVGMEDWCLPATTAGQNDPNDDEEPMEVHGYFTSPRGPVDFAAATDGCQDQEGILPSVEEMSNLIQQGRIPDSWPRGKYWLSENYFIDIATGIFTYSTDGSESCFYSCKQSGGADGVEGWDGVYGFLFKAPSLMPEDYVTSTEGCETQGGELPTAQELRTIIEQGLIPASWPKGSFWVSGGDSINITNSVVTPSADESQTCFYTCFVKGVSDGVEEWEGVKGLFTSPIGMTEYAAATEGCTNQGGELPTAQELQDLISQGRISESWPAGAYWVNGNTFINISNGTATQSEDGAEPCYYTCKITGGEDCIEEWDGVHGFYTFPLGPADHAAAAEGAAFQRGDLLTIEQLRLLIAQGMLPASWPTDAYYWTADKRWVNITDMNNAGTSSDGSESYYYSCFIEGMPDGVEAYEGIEMEDTYYTPPTVPVNDTEATAICQAHGGELPTLEALRLLVENGQIPVSWPKDSYYYTKEKYMVDISSIHDEDDILLSGDGSQLCYYTCELESEQVKEVPGFFTAPQYLGDLSTAVSECQNQGGVLPSLEALLLLIEQGRIPASWLKLKGYFWACASTNTPFCVNLRDGTYWYSETGSELCFYSCYQAGQPDGVAEWQPQDGLYTFPVGPANLADANSDCLVREGGLPSLQEMQVLIQQGRFVQFWPDDNTSYYWTSDNVLVNIRDHEDVVEPEPGTGYYYSCKKTGQVNGVETGREIRVGNKLFTYPVADVSYQGAIDGCLYQGGELATLEELRYLMEAGLLRWQFYWPEDQIFWTADERYAQKVHYTSKYISEGYSPITDFSEDAVFHYSCKIDLAPEENSKEVKGYFTAPEDPVPHSEALGLCHDQEGVLPSLEELLLLIELGRIPKNWPTDYPYWASDFNYTRFAVNIEDGSYTFEADHYRPCFFTCKIEGGENRMEQWTENGFYRIPQDRADYATAHETCIGMGGKLPTVTQLQQAIRRGVPDFWPTGNYWVSGNYIMNVADGAFHYSSDGSEACYFVCRRLDLGNGFEQGDELVIDGNLYMSPRGPEEHAVAQAKCVYQGGSLPTLDDYKRLIDQCMVPDSWPTDEDYLYLDLEDEEYPYRYVNITDSTKTGTAYNGVNYYYNCKIENVEFPESECGFIEKLEEDGSYTTVGRVTVDGFIEKLKEDGSYTAVGRVRAPEDTTQYGIIEKSEKDGSYTKLGEVTNGGWVHREVEGDSVGKVTTKGLLEEEGTGVQVGRVTCSQHHYASGAGFFLLPLLD